MPRKTRGKFEARFSALRIGCLKGAIVVLEYRIVIYAYHIDFRQIEVLVQYICPHRPWRLINVISETPRSNQQTPYGLLEGHQIACQTLHYMKGGHLGW